MKIVIASIALTALLGVANTAAASPPATPTQAARLLNAQSKASLGVSVRALSFLFSAKPGTFLLKDSLTQDGSWPYLQELERASYVKVNSVTLAEGTFVQISLTAKGQQIIGELGGP